MNIIKSKINYSFLQFFSGLNFEKNKEIYRNKLTNIKIKLNLK